MHCSMCLDATAAICQGTRKQGLITIRAGLYSNCVRFLPPLTIVAEQIDEGIAVLIEAVEIVAERIPYHLPVS